ncbi:MAG TPA: glycosyltransferase [Polyangiaceae bacterium]|nr:glycosyltransferase [Polyangiaceae bacterium]
MAPALTIGLAVYGQPIMLAEWFDRFGRAEVNNETDDVEVIVVDDCGTPPAEVPDHHMVHLLRMKHDVPWNQGECRNLAAQQAKGRVLMMLDPDMTLPEKSLAGFLAAAGQLREGRVVRPLLRHGDGKLDATSPNVYLIHRKDFLRCAYDLCYSGNKGYGDVELSNCWGKLYKEDRDRGLVLDFHHNGKYSDAQVLTISRDLAHNRKLFHERHRRCAKIGVGPFVAERSPLVRSEWEKVR